MRGQIALGIALSFILVFSIAANSLSADAVKFSARVLAKASKSNVMLLVKNSGKSTESIYEFKVTFTSGKPILSISRGGWDGEKSDKTVTFSTDNRPIKPGGRMIFLIKVAGAASSAFEWTANDKEGNELQSGELAKVRVRERKHVPEPQEIVTEINADPVRVELGGQVIVTGKGFSASGSVTILLDDRQELTTAITNDAGEFNAVVIIPSDTLGGGHMIVAKDETGKSSLIQILVVGGVGSTGGPTGPLVLSVATDKAEYMPGDTIKITGTAVLERPVSLQVVDPRGEIICGSNPPVNNATMAWEEFCPLPSNIRGGTYKILVKQLGHETSTQFTVKLPEGDLGEGGGVPGEETGNLKISTDKISYKSGETVKITLEGARAQGVVQIILVGPSGALDAKIVSTDENGVANHEYSLVAAELGTYQVTGKQDKFVVRATFEVTE